MIQCFEMMLTSAESCGLQLSHDWQMKVQQVSCSMCLQCIVVLCLNCKLYTCMLCAPGWLESQSIGRVEIEYQCFVGGKETETDNIAQTSLT